MPKAKFTADEKNYIEVITKQFTECETPETAIEIADRINLTNNVKEIVSKSVVNDIRRRKKLHVRTTVRRAKYKDSEFDADKVDVPKARKTFRDLIEKIAECGKLAVELRDALKGQVDKSFFF